MLLNMTIANFKSVKSPQTISFEALKDNRLSPSKVVEINDKLKAIKTSAIIGPNGAGKSSFVRALEVLNRVVTASEDNENPLASALTGTVFAYGIEKTTPATISIDVLLEKGDGSDENPTVIARYTLAASKDRIFEETLYHIYNTSKKLMFERKYDESDNTYAYRYGKMYRGEKKRLAARIPDSASFLGWAARKGGETCSQLYSWFTDSLHILPMGVSAATESYIARMLNAHPAWREQLTNFFWAVDITDIRRVGVRDDGKVVFTHVYINDKKADGYSNLFSLESLSLRRLTLLAVAFFECFTSHKTLVIDDFGMLLHPDVLCHLVEIFESCNKESQMLVVDCNPSLLKEGLLRRDGIWFAQKDHESSTTYFSLADFKVSRGKALTREKYLQGAFGALPITSEFYFVDDEKEVK
ncbi:MAG: AAA family ATPase [Spirochaetales bacterium]|uniref:AAA family ATPase n=1 Tax=Bullifex sp. TaxID=2815808 RepID=UPI002A57FD92|nr:AAA family ATPase [Bullifex sp.]MDD5973165.1 AAA family ATPase [Spirochaetales bacterium]MDD7272117.1 AAA family ATPase [Spirochaetales bacterium]MDY4067707.1 AAA family ATPase [Bullifex sp.]